MENNFSLTSEAVLEEIQVHKDKIQALLLELGDLRELKKRTDAEDSRIEQIQSELSARHARLDNLENLPTQNI